MLRSRPLALLCLLTVLACAESVTAPVSLVEDAPVSALGDPPRKIRITSYADSGPGSLRAALAEASVDPSVVGITIAPELSQLAISAPLEFSGTQPLLIEGSNVRIVGYWIGGDVFRFSVRSSITIYRLAVHFSQGSAFRIDVPGDATGTVQVVLNQVTTSNTNGHAVVVNDQSGFFADQNSMSNAGSAASLRVEVTSCRFEWIGQGHFDANGNYFEPIAGQDAIRVNEGGDGDVLLTVKGATVMIAGNDAIEVDERGNGNAEVRVETSELQSNGQNDGGLRGAAVRVEEADAGNLTSRVYNVFAYMNAQGYRISESGPGDVSATFALGTVGMNPDDAIVVAEDDLVAGGGNLFLDMSDVVLTQNGWGNVGNGTANVIVHEKGDGNVDARVTRTNVTESFYGGFIHREEGLGNLRATHRASSITGSIESGFGIRFDERGGGDLIAAVNGGSLSNNSGLGIFAGQAPTGAGSLSLSGVTVQGNGGGNIQVVPGQVTLLNFP